MTRISAMQRLAWGLGVMALGVLGALPFYHAAPDEKSTAQVAPTMLGEGVSLQVPGQRAIVPFQTPDLQPLPSEGETDQETVEATSGGAEVRITTPPRLPDEYRPLFPLDDSRRVDEGRVVAPGGDSVPPRKPVKTHTIHDGDTLASLATRYLGDAKRAAEILEANRTALSDPEILPIGVKIVIPRETTQEAPVDTAAGPEHRNLVPLPAIGFRRAGS